MKSMRSFKFVNGNYFFLNFNKVRRYSELIFKYK